MVLGEFTLWWCQMNAKASQFTFLSIVCSAVCSGWHQRRYQSSASLVFCAGYPSVTVDSPNKVLVMRKAVHVNTSSCPCCCIDSAASWVLQEKQNSNRPDIGLALRLFIYWNPSSFFQWNTCSCTRAANRLTTIAAKLWINFKKKKIEWHALSDGADLSTCNWMR